MADKQHDDLLPLLLLLGGGLFLASGAGAAALRNLERFVGQLGQDLGVPRISTGIAVGAGIGGGAIGAGLGYGIYKRTKGKGGGGGGGSPATVPPLIPGPNQQRQQQTVQPIGPVPMPSPLLPAAVAVAVPNDALGMPTTMGPATIPVTPMMGTNIGNGQPAPVPYVANLPSSTPGFDALISAAMAAHPMAFVQTVTPPAPTGDNAQYANIYAAGIADPNLYNLNFTPSTAPNVPMGVLQSPPSMVTGNVPGENGTIPQPGQPGYIPPSEIGIQPTATPTPTATTLSNVQGMLLGVPPLAYSSDLPTTAPPSAAPVAPVTQSAPGNSLLDRVSGALGTASQAVQAGIAAGEQLVNPAAAAVAGAAAAAFGVGGAVGVNLLPLGAAAAVF